MFISGVITKNKSIKAMGVARSIHGKRGMHMWPLLKAFMKFAWKTASIAVGEKTIGWRSQAISWHGGQKYG